MAVADSKQAGKSKKNKEPSLSVRVRAPAVKYVDKDSVGQLKESYCSRGVLERSNAQMLLWDEGLT